MLITAGQSVYRGHRNGSFELIAGSGDSTTGDLDGIGTAARFYNPSDVAWDIAANEVYICDMLSNRIRALNLTSVNVTTVAGSAQGFTDGVGAAAHFNNPVGNALFVPGGDDATLWGIDVSGATIPAGVGSSDAVGIVTAREEIAQKHRGAAHDLLLYFDAAVTSSCQ